MQLARGMGEGLLEEMVLENWMLFVANPEKGAIQRGGFV